MVKRPRPVPPLHTPSVCFGAWARRFFYTYLLGSPVPFIRAPAKAFLTWRVKRIKARMKNVGVEQKLAAPYCKGRGIDVGCGNAKTVPDAIGVDLTPKGKPGFAGSQLLELSEADVVASGDDLHMFKDGELDYVVARHNLEHYPDPVKTLQEWRRVLKKGGRMILMLPDEEFMHTISLDPTHYHVYTRQSLTRLLEAIGGWKVERMADAIPKVSFLLVAKKI